GEVLRDHVAHARKTGTVDLKVERGVHERLVGIDVLHTVHGADGERAAESATHAKELDHVKLAAKSTQELERIVDLLLRRLRFHGETNLVINHERSPPLRWRHCHRRHGSVVSCGWTVLNRPLTFCSPGHNLFATALVVTKLS